MPLAFHMVWREPKDHSSNCYFCLTNITGISSKSKHTVKYPDLPSAMRPVPHSEEFPVLKSPENLTFSDENSDSDKDHRQQGGEQFYYDLTFEANCSPSEAHFLTQVDFNDIVRDLNLSKKQAELLGFRRKLWNLLHQHTDVCFFHNHQNEFKEYFPQGNDLVILNDLCSLTDMLDINTIHLNGVYSLTLQELAYKLCFYIMGINYHLCHLPMLLTWKSLMKIRTTFGKDPV